MMKLTSNNLIGLLKQEAIYLIKMTGYAYRIKREDNHLHIHTRDYKQNRINLEIDNGKITKATWG